MDETIYFKALEKEQVYNIVKLMLNDVRKRLLSQEIEMGVTKEAIELIIEKGYDINFGARPLKRTIQAEVETIIAKKIISNEIAKKSRIQVYAKDGEIEIRQVKGE